MYIRSNYNALSGSQLLSESISDDFRSVYLVPDDFLRMPLRSSKVLCNLCVMLHLFIH